MNSMDDFVDRYSVPGLAIGAGVVVATCCLCEKVVVFDDGAAMREAEWRQHLYGGVDYLWLCPACAGKPAPGGAEGEGEDNEQLKRLVFELRCWWWGVFRTKQEIEGALLLLDRYRQALKEIARHDNCGSLRLRAIANEALDAEECPDEVE